MNEIIYVALLTLGAGICIPIGGVLASIERIRPNWLEVEFRHFMIALGGGLLLGAVVEVLLPEGMAQLQRPILGIALFISGGVLFFFVERFLSLRRRAAPQMIGMLLDYIPEAIALGGLLASGSTLAPLLALLIGLQNLPEGFNAYRELLAFKRATSKVVLTTMTAMALLGPLAGVSGYLLLNESPQTLAILMLIASGGILYLIFQDIAPQSRLKHHWAPPLGAVLGFGCALLAETWMATA